MGVMPAQNCVTVPTLATADARPDTAPTISSRPVRRGSIRPDDAFLLAVGIAFSFETRVEADTVLTEFTDINVASPHDSWYVVLG